MLGDTFLEKYADHKDPVTIIDGKRSYGVKAAAKHPIYENFRVKVSNILYPLIIITLLDFSYVFIHFLVITDFSFSDYSLCKFIIVHVLKYFKWWVFFSIIIKKYTKWLVVLQSL